jgi:hypothetical protein
MPAYIPESRSSRIELALVLLGKMSQTGFSHEEIPGTKEAVYSRQVEGKPGVRILVYTSVEQGPLGPEARSVGSDAIRVCAVYRNKKGQDRGITKAEARVNRTGQIEDIASRTHSRMREVWLAARQGSSCPHCGAPLFLSRKNNLVCADACWAQ